MGNFTCDVDSAVFLWIVASSVSYGEVAQQNVRFLVVSGIEGNVFEFNCRLDSLSSHCPGKARE